MDHVDHILIVDDDREIRELVGNYLKKNGLRTTVVADGRQMRAFLETTPVDLIVLDIMMPGDDGLLLCRELRAEGQCLGEDQADQENQRQPRSQGAWPMQRQGHD